MTSPAVLAPGHEAVLRLLVNRPAQVARLCGLERLQDALHGEWIKALVFGTGDMTLMAHRGSYKTTCLAFSMALTMLLYPRRNLLFLRKTDDDVLEVLRQVRLLLRSPVYGRFPAAFTALRYLS